MIARLPEFDEHTITDCILVGDVTAEDALIKHFQPLVRAFLATRTSRTDLIEEVNQDTMFAAVLALRKGKLRDSANLSAFVHGIARNQLADAIRKQMRRKTDPLPDGFDCVAPALETESDVLVAARREMESLEPADRRILWMTLIEGFKPGEIAAATGMTAELVRQRKFRALRKVVEKLQRVSRTRAWAGQASNMRRSA
jgi:RNA polymerase sigma factor (sigma-70 family)